jgi:hypothetical protein
VWQPTSTRRCAQQLEDILQALAQSKADDMRGLCVTCAGADAAATPSSHQTASDSTAATPAPHAALDAVRNVAAALPGDSSAPTPPSPPSSSPAALPVAPYDMYAATPPQQTASCLIKFSYHTCCRLQPASLAADACALTRLAVLFAPNARFSTTLWREILK